MVIFHSMSFYLKND